MEMEESKTYYEECSMCQGTGWHNYWSFQDIECPYCNGKGAIEVEED